jgi:hypothetical protein
VFSKKLNRQIKVVSLSASNTNKTLVGLKEEERIMFSKGSEIK